MVPRLRRLNELSPCMPLLVLLAKVERPVLPWSAGNSAMALNRFGSATFSISGPDNMVVGVGWVKPAEVIRDPVTTTSSNADSLAPLAGLAELSVFGTSAAPARIGTSVKTRTDEKQTYRNRLTLSTIEHPVPRSRRGNLLWLWNDTAADPSLNTLLHNRQSKIRHLCSCCYIQRWRQTLGQCLNMMNINMLWRQRAPAREGEIYVVELQRSARAAA